MWGQLSQDLDPDGGDDGIRNSMSSSGSVWAWDKEELGSGSGGPVMEAGFLHIPEVCHRGICRDWNS